jgi:hypothetical protein|tara:strand:- start:1891 stop:2112 length:222 start_codon:yes stop_codon:yes gene_type:complete
MSNFSTEADKLRAHLEELKRKHKKVHEEIDDWHGIEVTQEVRVLKTQKLFLKDEIYRIQRQLKDIGAYTNGKL